MAMASSRSSSADSSQSYDSVENYKKNQFSLTLAEKKDCLEVLHCTKTHPKGRFITWTSHWVKKRKVSLAVYKLLKIKRWHLTDENFIFDPLKRIAQFRKLTPSTTLWRDFKGENEIEEYRYSVDGILGKFLKKEAFDSLKVLDSMLEPLDDAQEAKTDMQAENVFEDLLSNYIETAAFPHKVYSDFLRSIGNALVQRVTHEKVPEILYERAIMKFVGLLTGIQLNVVTWCERDVHGIILDKITIPVKLGKEETSLRISSKPDLFLYCTPPGILDPAIILGVVEVKGKINDAEVLHSSDEEEDEDAPESPDATLSEKRRVSARGKKCTNERHTWLSSVEEVDEEEDEEDIIEELSLEQLMEDTPEWLTRITNLPPYAVKDLRQFLPQLLGEMLCVFRSEVVRCFKTKSGMQFGMGVVGFDVYFVTVTDPSHKSRGSLINDDSACLNVFVTRPFNMLVRDDRRRMIKILAASFHLDKLGV